MASLPHRARRAGLARRLAVLTRMAQDRVMYREKLRGHAAACAAIRAVLPAAKLDPAALWCLREFARDEEALRRLGDTPELARADAAFAKTCPDLGSAERLAADAARRAVNVAASRPPAPGASLLDWYAWALATANQPGPLVGPRRRN